MAIVHMSKRIERFFNQLNIYSEPFTPRPMFFDYDGKREVYQYNEEEQIELPDFTVEFTLVITQTGTYDPGDGCIQPPEFNVDSTEVEIQVLEVFDIVKGEYLRFNREEFTEVVNIVRELIEI